jgi:selenocysteine lyase/cysteine desulfurase
MGFKLSLLAEQFPLDNDLCYLNHAAVSPWAKCTTEAVCDFARENMQQGATDYPKWNDVEIQLRERLASLLNIRSTHEIALSKSTSEALSIIAHGIQWKKGDEVVISDHEFPSNRIVWESLSEQGVKVVEVNLGDGSQAIESITQAFNSRTRLVSISSVQYASGIYIDLPLLGKACRQHDILLCVDAIQSLGTIPFSQPDIQADFIVADGHKWLMAAEGLALLYIKEEHINTLKLHQFGWRMVQDKGNFDTKEWEPAQDATRFECGSPNMVGIHALNASLGLLLEFGITNIHSTLIEKTQHTLKQLKAIKGIEILSPENPKYSSGIITFKPSLSTSSCNSMEELYLCLMENKVICACRGGGIRFSPAFYTPTSTIDKAVAILRDILGA